MPSDTAYSKLPAQSYTLRHAGRRTAGNPGLFGNANDAELAVVEVYSNEGQP